MPKNIRRSGSLGRRTLEKDIEAIRVASNTYGGAGQGTDHGTLTGRSDDDHTQYAHLSQAEVVLGGWTFDTDVLPEANDAYDLGSSAKLWKKGYLSELEALLFVENSIHVEAGWLIVGYNQGTLQEEVDNTETDIDFGIDETGSNGLAVNDFILLRGYGQVEYMQITAQPGGAGTTIWTVVRDKDGTGANVWPQGAVFLVLGYNGDGRIELVAGQTDSPRISITEQGTTYSAQNERVRIGNMRGSFGAGANDYYGFGAGDYSAGNYLAYNDTDGFILGAGGGSVVINSSGVRIDTTLSYAVDKSVNFKDPADSDNLCGYIYTERNTTTDETNLYLVSTGVNASGEEANVFLTAELDGLYGVGIGLHTNYLGTTQFGYVTVDWKVGTGLYVGSTTGTTYDNDAIIEGGIFVGTSPIDPVTGTIYASNKIFVNETINGKMTYGVTVKTTFANEAYTVKEDGVIHTCTTTTENDTVGTIHSFIANTGGLKVVGFSEGVRALALQGVATGDNTTTSTAGTAPLELRASKISGGVPVAVGTSGNLMVVRNLSTTRMILKYDGRLFLDGDYTGGTPSTTGLYDKYDDIKILAGVRGLSLPDRDGLRDSFNEFIDYARPVLESTEAIILNDGQYGNDNDGSMFISVQGMFHLHNDAIRQLSQKFTEEIRYLKGKVLQLEARNENHN